MGKMDWVQEEIKVLKDTGRYVPIRTLQSAQGAWVKIDGRKLLNLCSNNYLGLANNPEVKKAMQEAIESYGVGAGAVRSIAGTMEIHIKLEEKIAQFKHMESSLVYQGGLLANLGTIPALVGKEDLVFSEELNHASIIDGVRLSSAQRVVFSHVSAKDLEEKLKAERQKGKRALIVTDGVFSMDGDIAPLKEEAELGEKYDSMVYVDDAHGEGVLGDHGRGIVDHFKVGEKVDIEMGTFSKAVGVMGGFVAGRRELIDYLKQKARPFLFSSALNPGEVAAIMKSIEIMERDDSLLKKLWNNSDFLKEKLGNVGYNTGKSKTPITPVMIGGEKETVDLSKALYEEGVFASPIVYPTVAKGTARIRLMPSAVHSREDLKFAGDKFEEVGKRMKLI
ncbi:MAG: glycine C-acetyltransferase [Candidatus Thermoplasmatota archaeon]|jgi:glycine C-acetyltransferase|nr:glycine C-acetyltransferase [Candidatus Thermoplasmatota archaeon]MCL5789653.1 glycine C-acetyltransferase [Candidatus Thermoplasmatota archaeon]